MAAPYEVIMQFVGKGFEIVKGLKADVVEIQKKADDIVDSFDKLGRHTRGLLPNFGEMSKKVNDIAKSLSNVISKGIGGIQSVISGIIGGFEKIIASVFRLAPILALIGVVILTFSRLWERNIGGMQTKFFSFITQIERLWYAFILKFDATLKEMEPLFNVLFNILLNGLLPVVTAVFDIINAFLGLPGPVKMVTVAVIGLALAFTLLSGHPIIMALTALIVVVSMLPAPLRTVAAALGLVTIACWALYLNPVGGTITTIAIACIALVYGLIKLNDWLKSVGLTGSKAFNGMRIEIMSLLGPLGTMISMFGDTGTLGSKAFDYITNGILYAMGPLGTLISMLGWVDEWLGKSKTPTTAEITAEEAKRKVIQNIVTTNKQQQTINNQSYSTTFNSNVPITQENATHYDNIFRSRIVQGQGKS